MGPLSVAVFVAVLFVSSAVPRASNDRAVNLCHPPCKDGGVICTWNDGGNGYNGSESCQRACGSPVGSDSACKLSVHDQCWWGYTDDSGWACFAGPTPCSPDKSVIASSYVPCAEWKRDYGGCNCDVCCSKTCTCINLIEDKAECVCGNGTLTSP